MSYFILFYFVEGTVMSYSIVVSQHLFLLIYCFILLTLSQNFWLSLKPAHTNNLGRARSDIPSGIGVQIKKVMQKFQLII